jgi:ribosome-associated protein
VRITDTLSLDEREVEERFVRASGPGGQNVNKVATAVELRFDVGASSLPDAVKARLRALAGSWLTSTDVLRITAQEHRTQAQNRDAARARLVDLVRQASRRPRPRRRSRPSLAARERRVERKVKRGALKRRRRAHGDDE